MKRSIRALVLALTATVTLAGAASAQPIDEPASCFGYLSAYANPNNAFIIHTLTKPAAEDLGVPMGQLVADLASLHLGGIEACIPE